MRKEQMVGSRLPAGLVQDLEMIERVEQTDRSTAVRRLLHRAVSDWKREYYAENYSRLVDVKTKYDRHNLFQNAQSIPPRRH